MLLLVSRLQEIVLGVFVNRMLGICFERDVDGMS
jgi:hypothetical protein